MSEADVLQYLGWLFEAYVAGWISGQLFKWFQKLLEQM